MSMIGDGTHQSSSSSNDDWQPLQALDLTAIGFATCVGVSMALLAFHVVLHRAWVPYKAIIPSLIACTGLAGILSTIAVTIRYGIWGSTTGDTPRPVGCEVGACVIWLGGGALFSCGYLRIHRYYNVLVRHKVSMLPVLLQLSIILLVFAVPAALMVARPSLVTFDAQSQECRYEAGVLIQFGLAMLVILIALSVALTVKLRTTHVQAPEEFCAALTTSASMVLGLAAIAIVHTTMEEDRASRRRVMLVVVSLTAAGILAPPLLRPLSGYIEDEEGFERSGDYGFCDTHQQEKMKESLRMFVEMNVLASCPTGTSESSSDLIIDFYRATLSREVVQDYFSLQASTMRILDTYVREGAPKFVPVSAGCRSFTLSFRAVSPLIFTQARSDILASFRGPTRNKAPPQLARNSQKKRVAIAEDSGSVDSPFSNTSSKLSGSVNSFLRQSSMSAVASSYIDSSSFDTQDLDYRFFSAEAKQKMSTPVATPSPSGRNDVVHVPPCPAGLPPRPPRKSTSGSVDRTMFKVTRESRKHVAARSPAESSEDRSREGSHESSTPTSMLHYLMDDSEKENEEEEKIATVVVEARTPASVPGTLQTVFGNRSAPVHEYADESETRKPSLGETSVKTMAAVDNLQVAFGLREESGSSDDDDEDDGDYDDCASQGHHSISKCGSSGDNCNNMTEASRVIRNPIFGPTSRTVGRQPEGKARAVAAWLSFAPTRTRSASRVSPSPKVGSSGKNVRVFHSMNNVNDFGSVGGNDKGSEVIIRKQDLDSLPTKDVINDMENGTTRQMFDGQHQADP